MPSEKRRDGSSLQLTGQVPIDNTAGGTIIIDVTSKSRNDVTILNIDDTDTVYIGNSGLDETTGFPLAPGAAITRKFRSVLYGFAPTGTPKVAFISSEDY